MILMQRQCLQRLEVSSQNRGKAIWVKTCNWITCNQTSLCTPSTLRMALRPSGTRVDLSFRLIDHPQVLSLQRSLQNLRSLLNQSRIESALKINKLRNLVRNSLLTSLRQPRDRRRFTLAKMSKEASTTKAINESM